MSDSPDPNAGTLNQRLLVLSGVITVAVAVVVVLLLSGGKSGGGGTTTTAVKKPGDIVRGQTATTTLLAGIPQQGRFLGSPTAPVVLAEFADVQCPFCKEYTDSALPTVITNFVRTGKVRLEFHSLPILSQGKNSDSDQGAALLSAAAEQNKLWNVLELLYANQGQEQSGWLTDPLANRILQAAGTNVAAVNAAVSTAAVKAALAQDQKLADTNGFDGTPSFLLGQPGKAPKKLDVQALDASYFSGVLNAALTAAAQPTP